MQENLYSDDERLYLQMMQEIITRMATNSANAKTWLVTIVAAILTIGYSIKEIHYWLLLALVPTLALWYLDAYYLQLERKLRNRERYYINLKKAGKTAQELNEALYDFSPLPKKQRDENLKYVKTDCQMLNSSVYPLYLVMCLVVIIVTGMINEWFNFLCQL